MPNPITCANCICNQPDRGYAILKLLVDRCRDMCNDGTCQIKTAERMAGVIEGEWGRKEEG
jgi:hypothetical protein